MFIVQGNPAKGYEGNTLRYFFVYFKNEDQWFRSNYLLERFDVIYSE